jgi:transposase
MAMLQNESYQPLSDIERQLFTRLVPPQHFLRQLLHVVDFERFRPTLAGSYCPGEGRPALDPVFMLKLDLLSIQYRYSDRELMRQVQVNMAYRLFLDIGCETTLPHHTTMTYFRDRVGAEALQKIFHGVLGQARELGLVKDRLRLKDATHLIANIAIPTTICLVAQMRDQVLEAAEPFAPDQVAVEWQHADVVCASSEDLPDVQRLVGRVQHLREVVSWADALPQSAAFAAAGARAQDKLRAALALAHKVLADREDPKASDKVISVVDADARCGKHGAFFDGYLADVTMDADSELLTGINVLPANGNEGGDAAHLIRQEEAAHGNDVQGISIDGAGYRGPVLRELTDPNGLPLEVFTPPSKRVPLTVFGPEQFALSADHKTLTCPAGQTTTMHERNNNDTGEKFRFSKKQCGACALREQCLADPKTKSRTVVKNEYEAEYQAAQAQAQTPQYAQVRKEHPAIERKLSELVNRHDLRHARYRGLSKVLRQALLSGMAVNLKRLVKLCLHLPKSPRTEAVRAELVTGK